jgi:hypothetical protein
MLTSIGVIGHEDRSPRAARRSACLRTPND